jgi:hypothetical protein
VWGFGLTLVSLLLLASFSLDGSRSDSSNILYASVLLMSTLLLPALLLLLETPKISLFWHP